MRVPPVENPTCAAFGKYEEVPDTVPLDLLENNFTWVASKLSGAAGALGAESIELKNWLLCFGCASDEFRVVVSYLSGLVANSSPPWANYRAMIACRLVALDKFPGVRLVGIGETLCRAITKLFMRAAGDQANAACGSLQLCAGLGGSIEGATHAVVQRQQDRDTPAPRGGADEVSEEAEDKSVAATSRADRARESERFRGIVEFLRPPRGWSTAEEGEIG